MPRGPLEAEGRGSYRPGDRDDFERLYQASYPKLLRTVYAILGDGAAAEDCVQDAFVRAFQAWPRFRPDRPAEAWMYQIAINTAISHRRRAKLRQVGELVRRLGRPSPGPDPGESAGRSDMVAALMELRPRVAAAFILRYLYGYTNREIAQLENVSERSVGARLAHARERLARRLGHGSEDAIPDSDCGGSHIHRRAGYSA
jgi:RNA polymerase sigma-70 factor (ECF subfamily)